MSDEKWGCFVDADRVKNEVYFSCCIDYGQHGDCTHAMDLKEECKTKFDCKFWRKTENEEDADCEKEEDHLFEEYEKVHHPPHYTDHPSGIECIQVTEHMGFCLGNAIKYIWRSDKKGSKVEDLKKAIWYINRELQRIGG